ncbi:recombinase family protein [Cytophagaceae bacterium YF14B1]|uniref:Recombinase family protein n=1 Tax=Xanthocytophaga flava TaxID=3048013 RepID=A0AAE3U9X3_9BACT|nr:recombinase family protein [Xanthocytophaga flavus]MDJ1485564.1 recombinase family protein [Xanthocytophaga flavus]
MPTFISYYRVSTQKQGRSGLGLDAQRADVERYIAGKGELIAEFTEIESGRKNNRQQLHNAIEQARKTGSTLIVAKLDRLSRDAAFTIQLSNSSVNFVCVDNPHINKMTIGILALVNQDEAERISLRTKAALREKKKKIDMGIYTNSQMDPLTGELKVMKPDKNGNYRLGSPQGFTADITQAGMMAAKEKAHSNENTKRTKHVIRDTLKENPDASLTFLAERLNTYGIPTSRGKRFNKFNVAYFRKLVKEEMSVKNE